MQIEGIQNIFTGMYIMFWKVVQNIFFSYKVLYFILIIKFVNSNLEYECCIYIPISRLPVFLNSFLGLIYKQNL